MTPSFTCPKCGRTSYHPDDVKYGYCGACHQFTGTGIRYAQWLDCAWMSSMNYDVHGNPISFDQWEMLFRQKTLSKYGIGNTTDQWWRIGGTYIGRYWVSTIWTGDDHSFGQGPLEIFETMVFAQGATQDDWTQRYATKEEALAGHAAICAKLKELENNDG